MKNISNILNRHILFIIVIFINIRICLNLSITNNENKSKFVMETYDKDDSLKERHYLNYNYKTSKFDNYEYYEDLYVKECKIILQNFIINLKILFIIIFIFKIKTRSKICNNMF